MCGFIVSTQYSLNDGVIIAVCVLAGGHCTQANKLLKAEYYLLDLIMLSRLV